MRVLVKNGFLVRFKARSQGLSMAVTGLRDEFKPYNQQLVADGGESGRLVEFRFFRTADHEC